MDGQSTIFVQFSYSMAHIQDGGGDQILNGQKPLENMQRTNKKN